MIITAHRYHDFSYGHRVYGHENVCANAHGHNGRVTFYCSADTLDDVGRVIDFKVIKTRLCDWLEIAWDHRFLLWENDPWLETMKSMDAVPVSLPFNPTAENLASYLLNVIGPLRLMGTGITLQKVKFMETRKCGATCKL